MKTVEEFMSLLRQKLTEQREKKVSYRQQVINEIRKRYSLEDEIALINNYNAYQENNELVELKQEYDAYQAYRAECKRRAREKTEEGEE